MDKPSRQAGIERRPLASRNFRVFQSLAASLVAWRISPNAISVAGMACAAGTAILLALTDGVTIFDRIFFAGAAGLIQLRLLANLLDGLVAVEGNRRSPTGEVFNEVPDRVSDALVLVSAGYATDSAPWLGWTAGLLAVFVSYIRMFGRSLGLHADYRGPMAKQQRMFIVTFACVLNAALPVAWLPKVPAMAEGDQYGPMWMALALVSIGCMVTAIRRLRRIVVTLSDSERGT
jgi:phosphatidylglycerophosphate synthase